MRDHRSLAERLAEASRMIRSPLARDLSGEITDRGQDGVVALDQILRDLPSIEATTPADALALASIASDMLGLMAANAEGNDAAKAAVVALFQALVGLKTCLADLAGRSVGDFAISEAIHKTRLPQ